MLTATQSCCEFAGPRLLLPAAHPIDSQSAAAARVCVILFAAALICSQVPSDMICILLLQDSTRSAFCCFKTRTAFCCSKTRTQPNCLTRSEPIRTYIGSGRFGLGCELGLYSDQYLPNPNNPKPDRINSNPTRTRFCPPLPPTVGIY